MLLPDKQIIAVDFDGALAETEYPTIIAPIPEIIDFIKSLKAKGNIVILWTCRHNQSLVDAVKRDRLLESYPAIPRNFEWEAALQQKPTESE